MTNPRPLVHDYFDCDGAPFWINIHKDYSPGLPWFSRDSAIRRARPASKILYRIKVTPK